MRKVLTIFLGVSIIMVFCGMNASAATIKVPQDHATIQQAIDAASLGDTIIVAAGTYDSTLETFPINVDKSLTLLGAQANVDPRPKQGGRTGDESIIDADETSSAVIVIWGSDVEINGFTITGGWGDMVKESGSANNLLFRYNILYDDLNTVGDEAIQIKNSDGVIMEYNYAYDILQDAFNLSVDSTGLIRYNEAHDIYSENAAIYCYGSTDITIQCNLVYDVICNDGIKLGMKGGGDAALYGGSILDNVVYNTAQDGISVYMSGILVEGNDVYNSESENGAIYVAYAVSDITITGNIVHDNTLQIHKWDNPGGIMIGTDVDAANVHVNDNNIFGNLDSVSPNVDFEPWLDGALVIVNPCGPQVIEVVIDIKPDSDPNSINLGSAGVIPVAILSSETFDATTVDPATVSLAGAAVKMAGKSGKYLSHIEDVNGDELMDLVCQVLTEGLVGIVVGDSVAVLTAETYDGQAIRGEDSISIVK